MWVPVPTPVRDVSENKLTEVCPEIGQLPSLTRLDLHTNQLKELPPAIGNLTAMKHLWVPVCMACMRRNEVCFMFISRSSPPGKHLWALLCMHGKRLGPALCVMTLNAVLLIGFTTTGFAL